MADHVREIAGLVARTFGQGECHVARQVAVAGVPGALDDDGRPRCLWEPAFGDQCIQRLLDQL